MSNWWSPTLIFDSENVSSSSILTAIQKHNAFSKHFCIFFMILHLFSSIVLYNKLLWRDRNGSWYVFRKLYIREPNKLRNTIFVYRVAWRKAGGDTLSYHVPLLMHRLLLYIKQIMFNLCCEKIFWGKLLVVTWEEEKTKVFHTLTVFNRPFENKIINT